MTKINAKPLRLGCRIWLYRQGAPGVFGDGKCCLLETIKRAGSLKAATDILHISYRKAWSDLRKAEKCLGVALLKRARGGVGGGETKLTDAARRCLQAYRELRKGADKDLKARLLKFKATVQRGINY